MERETNLDTVRGVACILVVLFHVVGPSSDTGLRLESDSAFRVVNEALRLVRMPLFTFLSGVVYALRPVKPGGGASFAHGKLKRLLLPFISISLIFAVVQKLVPGTNTQLEWAEIPVALIWPYIHMWFVVALLLVFAVVGLLDYGRALDHPLQLIALFVVACTLYEPLDGAVGILAWNRALYLLPFFLAGVILKRFGLKWVMLCLLIGLAFLHWDISIGVVFGMLLLIIMPANSVLAWIGTYSYSIYLLHIFGAAASRIAWEWAGLTNIPFLVVSGTLAGLLIPIGIHIVLKRVPYLSRAILGVRCERRDAGSPSHVLADGPIDQAKRR